MIDEKVLHPLDAVLADMHLAPSGLEFPPKGWAVIQSWGLGWALREKTGNLRVLIDAREVEGSWWLHVSASRKNWTPSHDDMKRVKQAFIGDRYAYTVWPPEEYYVSFHPYCLHLWSKIDSGQGAMLPEFSAYLRGIGKSI
jgi:hypothetical protein